MRKTASLIRMVPRTSRPGNPVLRRTLATLTTDFLPNILAEEGFTKFLEPLEDVNEITPVFTKYGAEETVIKNLFVHFSIDRDNVCIRADFNIKKTQESFDKDQIRFSINYPSYSPDITPPSLPGIQGIPVPERVQEVANTMWRVFCICDFLSLKIEAMVHPDGSMSFPESKAIVDESAAHRQPEIFANVSRTESDDEVEAERSNLVYRRYFLSILC
jgi:hypothetical protein